VIFQQKIRQPLIDSSERVSIASIHPELHFPPTRRPIVPLHFCFSTPDQLCHNGVFHANKTRSHRPSHAHHAATTPLSVRRKAATVAKTASRIQHSSPILPPIHDQLLRSIHPIPIVPSLPEAPPIPHTLQSRRHVLCTQRNHDHERIHIPHRTLAITTEGPFKDATGTRGLRFLQPHHLPASENV